SGLQDAFEKFTEGARLALSLAQEEAQRLNHNYMGTEHLLLGLVREEQSDFLAVKMLQGLGVHPEVVRGQVVHIIGRGDRIVMERGDRIVIGEIRLTPRAKKVIELAVDEARRLNHHYLGTEHLLLGLVREGEGIAAGVLESLGVNLDRARRILAEPVFLQTFEGSVPVPRPTGPKNNVVTCRLDDAAVGALDALVEAGIRSTRSDAAAWLISAGIEAHRELFDRVNNTVSEIRKLRQEAQQIARQVTGNAADNGTEEPGEEPHKDQQTPEQDADSGD
ncbi:MAG: Clp protease N-terminal domain-containing protein, partial [Nitrososphaerota archaeon]